jgi:IS4 transposase
MQWVSPWSITSTDKKRTAHFTLTVQDTPRKKRQRSEEKRLLLATNLEVSETELVELAKEYDGRWGIETGYRVKEHDFRIKTRTRLIATRLFLWMLQFIIYNQWILARLIQERRDPTAIQPLITAGQFKLKVLMVLGILRPNR